MRMSYVAIGVITTCLAIVIWFESHRKRSAMLLDCSVTFDTLTITKEWGRNAYPEWIYDSIVIGASYLAFDTAFCYQVPVKDYKALISGSSIEYCELGDLYPPFKIIKPRESDTLTVIQHGQVMYFKIPCDANVEEESDDFYRLLKEIF